LPYGRSSLPGTLDPEGAARQPSLRVAVVGAGVTGLATAFLLRRQGAQVTVFEASAQEGGLAGSFRRDGFAFDFGPHELCTANPELIDLVRETCGDDLIEVEKRIAHHFLGRYVRYPFEVVDVLRNIGPALGARAVAEVSWCRAKNLLRRPADDSFESWTAARFGSTLYGLYFGPYTKKVWGIDPSRLDPRTASQRVTIDSVWDLVRKTFAYHLLGAEDFKHAHSELHRRFFYLRRGVGTLQSHLRRRAEELGVEFRFGRSLSGIERDGNRVSALRFTDGSEARDFDYVVSTIPLSQLVRLALPERAESLLRDNTLPFRGMAFVFLRVNRPKVLDYHWVYYSGSAVPFQRMTEFGHFGAEMSPPGTTGLALEVSCVPGDGTWEASDAEIAERCVQGLVTLGLLERADLAGYDVVRQRFAYPVQVRGFIEKAQNLLTAVSEVENLVTIGRQGLFRYCNMNECLEMAFDVVPELMARKTSIRYTKEGSWLGVGLTDRYVERAAPAPALRSPT
jgi:protoporphyrinogen oxidase